MFNDALTRDRQPPNQPAMADQPGVNAGLTFHTSPVPASLDARRLIHWVPV